MSTLWHGRFEGGPSPELLAFSESLSFDRRLATDDIAGSGPITNNVRTSESNRDCTLLITSITVPGVAS